MAETNTTFAAPGETEFVGQPRNRVDARIKVTGQATYAAEFEPSGLLHAVIVRSPIAKGRISSLNSDAARNAPGVVAIYVPGSAPEVDMVVDAPGASAINRIPPLQAAVLREDRILFAGQIVAAAVAETLEQAEHAATLIQLRYAEEGAVVTLDQGRPGARQPAENGGSPIQISKGDADAALASAEVTVDASFTLATENHHPMEMLSTTAFWEADKLTLWDTTQGVMSTRNTVAASLGIPASRVHVICPYVGGGFGCKGVVWPHVPLIAAMARQLRRPVKHVMTRQDMTVGCGHRPEFEQRVRIGADRDGVIQAIRHDAVQQTATSGDFLEPAGSPSTVAYGAEAIRTTLTTIPLDRPSPSFMRAPMEQPGCFALECAIDELAYALDMDPIALRVANQPATDPLDGKPWTLRRTTDCFTRGAERFGWAERSAEPGSMRDGDWSIGIGCAQAVFPGIRWEGSARVRMDFDGSVTLESATQDLGTGTYTILAQAAAEVLGIPPERIRVEIGDSDLPRSGVSGGSTTAASVIPAVVQASERLLSGLADLAATDPDGPFAGAEPSDIAVGDGVLRRGNARESYADFMRRMSAATGSSQRVEAKVTTNAPDEMSDYACYSSAAQFCALRVHEPTGRWRIDRWLGVFDVGRILNEKLARSQLKGGVIYGLGAALMEATETDPATGRVVTRGLADYHVPVHADLPQIDIDWIGEPDPIIGPLGNRGVGEIGSVGVSAAIANALFHATGRRQHGLPMTIHHIMVP